MLFTIIAIVIALMATYFWYARKETLVGYDKDNQPIYVDTACVQSVLYDTAGALSTTATSTIALTKEAYAVSKVQAKIAKMNADAANLSLKQGWDDASIKRTAIKEKSATKIAKIEAEGDIKIAAAAVALQATLQRIAEAKARAV